MYVNSSQLEEIMEAKIFLITAIQRKNGNKTTKCANSGGENFKIWIKDCPPPFGLLQQDTAEWVAYQQSFTSHSLERLEVQDQGSSKQTWCLVRILFLVHRWTSYCVLTRRRGEGALWGLLNKFFAVFSCSVLSDSLQPHGL